MEKRAIEDFVREIHREMWRKRALLWPGVTAQLIDVTEPELAAKVHDIRYEYFEELAPLEHGIAHYQTAGLIDRRPGQKPIIAISRRFSFVERRFTGAHEIGHWFLHPALLMHRDRPIEHHGKRPSRSRAERDADYFAACLLMPEYLVIREFEARFHCIPFVFDDNAAFLLNPRDPESLLRPHIDSMDRTLALAGATSYGRPITSLTERFRVSRTAMAIRIQELRLIQQY